VPANAHPDRLIFSLAPIAPDPFIGQNKGVFDLEPSEPKEFYEAAPAMAVPAGKLDRLSTGARLQMIASILAMAVLRGKARKVMKDDGLPAARESLADSGEGLDLVGKQSVHAHQLVRKP
jgi:hypothetical protein